MRDNYAKQTTNLHDFEPKFLQTYKDALDSYAKMHGIDCNGSCYDYLNGKVINRESVEKGLTITIDGIPFDILQTPRDTVPFSVSVLPRT